MEKRKMKQVVALVLAGSALVAGPDAQAANAPVAEHGFAYEAPMAAAGPSLAPLRVSEDGEEGSWFWSNGGGSGSGDDNGGDSDDCTAADDPSCAQGGAGNAAPAGTVAPPQNGLFTNGTAPQVKSN
jgi:hypothetical protein